MRHSIETCQFELEARSASHGSRIEPRHHETREFEAQLCAQFKTIVIARSAFPNLPFITTEGFPSHGFATAKSIVTRKFIAHTRTELVVTLERGIHLQPRLKGIAQCGIDAHVEGVAGGSGVAWIIFDVERREESQRIELLLRCLLIVEGKAFSFDVGDGTAPQARAQRNLLPREEISVTRAF